MSPVSRDRRLLLVRRLAFAVAAAAGAAGCGSDGEGAGARGPLAAAEMVYREGEYEEAFRRFEDVRLSALSAGDSASAAVAMTWMGLASYQLGDYEEARSLGESALRLKERLGLDDELARSLNALGLLAWSEGRLGDAQEIHARSLRAATAVDDSAGIARALNNLALVHADLGHFGEADRRYREARALYHALDVPMLEGRVQTNLGALHAERGDAVAAESALLQAFELYRREGDPLGELNALGQLGVVYAAQGDPQRGLAYLDSARVIAGELGLPREEASNLEQLANIHWNLGSRRLALDLFARADSINVDVGLPYEHGANLRARSAVHRELGNLALAGELIEEAIALHTSIGARAEVLADRIELARLRLDQLREGDAEAELGRAEELAGGLESSGARIEVALARAELAERLAEPRAVLEALSSVEALVDDTSVDRRWRWHSLRTRSLRAVDDPEAVDAGRRAVELVDQIRAGLSSRLLRGSLLEDRREIYTTLVEILLERGRTDEAFSVADAARARDLASNVEPVDGNAPSPERTRAASAEEILVRISYLDRSLEEWYASTPPEERDAAFDSEVGARTEERERARVEYARLLAERDRGGEPTLGILGIGEVSVDETSSVLRPDEAVVEYLLTEERVFVFIVRTGGLTVRTLDLPEAQLRSRLRVARVLAGDPSADPETVTVVLGGLFDALIAPVVESGALLGAERLIVVPDGHLSYLPFAALYDRSTSRYLVESHIVSDVPSAAALVALRRRGERDGVVREGAGFAPFPERLPASAGEVRRFADHHPGETHVGRSATEARLREALDAGRLVHAAAHGIMNERNPLFSLLELRAGSGETDDDGLLRVHEMLALRTASPLVFLSACETGAGPVWGSDVVGGRAYAALSQALLQAGARNVVGTLWLVRDDAAAELATTFYENLADAPTSESLARAQRAMLAEESTRAPFFWAGYRLTGGGS